MPVQGIIVILGLSKIILSSRKLFGKTRCSGRTIEANAQGSPKEQYLVLPSKSSPRESPEGVCIMHATDIVEASKPAGANGFAQLMTRDVSRNMRPLPFPR